MNFISGLALLGVVIFSFSCGFMAGRYFLVQKKKFIWKRKIKKQ